VNPDFWLDPWRSPTTVWLVLAAALTALACGIPGCFLVLRRMSLTGDAISHSVLPGIVIGFVVSGSLDSPWLVLGAAASGWIAVMIIEALHRRGGVREDAATGVVFTAMFALGLILLRLTASRVDLDPDCVLFGNLETAIHGASIRLGDSDVPQIVLTTGAAAVLAVVFTFLLFHRLLGSSFDPSLARLTGQSPALVQSLLLGLTAAVVVAAFQTVGAVMAVALLVLPAASSLMLARRLPQVLCGVVIHSIAASVTGLYLATWADCNLGAAVVLAGAGWFLAAWFVAGRIRPGKSAA
jgi:manganese/zinc/iron transport system permease protein